MGYLEQNALLSNPDFQVRLRLAIVKACTQIIGEAIAPGARATKRHNLATSLLKGSEVGEQRFALAAVAAGLITPANVSDDTAYDTAVSSLFDKFAGVSAADA